MKKKEFKSITEEVLNGIKLNKYRSRFSEKNIYDRIIQLNDRLADLPLSFCIRKIETDNGIKKVCTLELTELLELEKNFNDNNNDKILYFINIDGDVDENSEKTVYKQVNEITLKANEFNTLLSGESTISDVFAAYYTKVADLGIEYLLKCNSNCEEIREEGSFDALEQHIGRLKKEVVYLYFVKEHYYEQQ